MASSPFVWGSGGRRMTPEEIAMQRQLAEQQRMAAADYSPVGHWTQGLARMSQGLFGGLRERRADRAEEANVAENNAITKALIEGMSSEEGLGQSEVMAALLNPNSSPEVRQVAGMAWQGMQPPEPPKPTEFERLLMARGIEPGSEDWNTSLDRFIAGKSDPNITVTLPGGGIFVGPQSELSTVLQGGASQPAAPQPGTIEDGYRFIGGDPANPNSWEPVGGGQQEGRVLNRAAQSQTISRQEAERVRQSLGPSGQSEFDNWLSRNNIRIGG